jgi:propionate kinase
MAPEAYLYGLPWKYYEELGVRRYGFHGTSHRYVSQRAHSLLNLAEDDSGLVVAHLGNGASICAVRNGQSVDTSMGMTPLEGLMMGTRSGDVDFGAMSWVASQTNQSLGDLERVVNKESGLLGISRLFIHYAFQVTQALVGLAGDPGHRTKVDIATAGTHHQAFQRRHSH